MFSNFSFSSSSAVPREHGLDTVSVELLQTPQDRESYLNYLLHNPELSPLQKLFGLQAPEEVCQKKIGAHARRLYLYIHPDKVPEPERERCTHLFRLVKEAEEAASSASSWDNKTIIPPLGPWSSYFDPVQIVLDAIKDGKWLEAKRLCETARNHLEEDKLSVLKSIILARLGELPAAIEAVPPGADQLRQIWLQYQIIMERAQLDQSSVGESECHDLLNKMKSVSISGLPVNISSHFLYKLLMEFYLQRGDLLSYQRYLREAIRSCPSCLEHEKRQLIQTLRRYLVENYTQYENEPENPNFIDQVKPAEEIERLKPSIFKSTTKILVTLNMKKAAKALENLDVCGAIGIIENALDELETPQPLFSIFSPLCGFFQEGFHDNSANRKKLNICYNVLKGSVYFDQGDIVKAAHHFSLVEDKLLLGLVSFDLHQYARAVGFWEKRNNEDADRYIFATINYCDTFYISEDSNFHREQLGEVDEKQLQLIDRLKKGARAGAGPL